MQKVWKEIIDIKDMNKFFHYKVISIGFKLRSELSGNE